MALHDPTQMLDKLKLALPDGVIERLAHALGVVERETSTFEPVLFVWTLILGFSTGAERSLASLARVYQRATGTDYTREAFHKRLDASVLALLRKLHAFHLAGLPKTPMGPFDSILAIDATVVRLWNGLIEHFESNQPGQAALKVQFVFDVADSSANRLKVHSSRQHELTRWRSMGKWVANSLLLMDLGYYSFWHFHNIASHGGFFLSRLKSNCSLLILEDLTGGPGRRANVEGMTVSEALAKLKGKRAHWLVEVPVTLRSGREVYYRWRAIVELNEDTGAYHCYLTNAPESVILCEDARGLYALRWQIEVAFKGLKSVGRLHRLPSKKPIVVKILIHAALLFMMLSGWLRHLLFGVEKLYHCSLLRAMTVVAEWAQELLFCIAETREGFTPRCMLEMMKNQMRDPNDLRDNAFAIPSLVEHSCGGVP